MIIISSQKTKKYFIIANWAKMNIIGTVLRCRLMVGQEILVLFIMVRIRAPQPKLNNAPTGHFLIFLAHGSVRAPAQHQYENTQLEKS